MRIKLKIGVNEVEIEGSTSDIEKAIKLIPDIIQTLPEEILEQKIDTSTSQNTAESIRLDSYIPSPHAAATTPQPSNFPEIQIGKGDSLSDIITKLFTNSWGRSPRKLGEVREALQTYGQAYPKQSVAVSLLRLAQSAKLRRFKGEGGEYVYTASSTLAEDVSRATSQPP